MDDKKETAGLRPAAFEAGENAQSNNPSNPLLVQALRYAERGWAVFPLQPKGKVPLTSHGHKDATTNLNQINQWWGQYPDANIGIAVGRVSGFFVLDIDGDDGEKSLKSLEKIYGSLPPTGEIITGGGGRHLYFKMPETGSVRNSAGKIADKIDVRGDGGYVVAPPSIHVTGKPYAFSVDTHSQIVSAPDWLLKLMVENSKIGSENNGGLIADIELIPEGKRNSTLTTLCGHLLSRRVHPALSLSLCMATNRQFCQPPLPDEEVHQIVNSIAGREMAKMKGNPDAA